MLLLVLNSLKYYQRKLKTTKMHLKPRTFFGVNPGNTETGESFPGVHNGERESISEENNDQP